MIIVKLTGGLGNQMFQYALGRKLSILKDTELKLDIISELENPVLRDYYKSLNQLRDYGLCNYNIEGHLATQKDINPFLKKKWYERLLPYYKRAYIKQQQRSFDPNIFKVNKNIYLEGNWQSSKYFDDIKNILVKEFTIKSSLDEKNEMMLNHIVSSDSICVHIRRGDYVSNSSTNSKHGALVTQYYLEAFKYITKSAQLSRPTCFIFSDDLDWVRENIKFDSENVYVDINYATNNPHLDINLMKQCKHFIIANSTFSWWGAWLSETPNKIIVAPRNWYADSNIKTDILPETWVKL